MRLHHLRPAPGAKTERRRVGRGRAAGQGKTAGRGTKGLKARGKAGAGYEGGQMPLIRRVPKKKGFTNVNREEWAVVNVERLAHRFEANQTVTPEALVDAGLVRKRRPVKVLGSGEIDRPLVVHAHAFTRTAREKIEGAGGQAQVLGGAAG